MAAISGADEYDGVIEDWSLDLPCAVMSSIAVPGPDDSFSNVTAPDVWRTLGFLLGRPQPSNAQITDLLIISVLQESSDNAP